jgi:ribosome maturation factor RimP
MTTTQTLTDQIEAAVAAERPDVEVWDVTLIPAQGLVRVLIEHPDGVDLAMCESISRILVDVRERYAIEVSSPGIERPLVKTSHFTRAVGETVRVRLTEPLDGRRNLTGRLVAADDETLTLDVDGAGELRVARSRVGRANIVWSGRP